MFFICYFYFNYTCLLLYVYEIMSRNKQIRRRAKARHFTDFYSCEWLRQTTGRPRCNDSAFPATCQAVGRSPSERRPRRRGRRLQPAVSSAYRLSQVGWTTPGALASPESVQVVPTGDTHHQSSPANRQRLISSVDRLRSAVHQMSWPTELSSSPSEPVDSTDQFIRSSSHQLNRLTPSISSPDEPANSAQNLSAVYASVDVS